MTENSILNAKDFAFAPFTPNIGGDSGALLLASLKSNPQVQYVIKSDSPELACNEFMYHHIASALGMYTQEARLFKGIKASKYAVGINYVPNARKLVFEEANEDNKRSYYAFRTLYVILNEADSEEFYLDEQNRVFKLDNAASFNLDVFKVTNAIKYRSKEPPEYIWQMLINGLDYLEYNKYGILLHILYKYFGRFASETGFELIKRFSAFDLSSIMPALETLEKVYPLTITEYYPAFIKRRINACKQFVCEHNVSEFTEEKP